MWLSDRAYPPASRILRGARLKLLPCFALLVAACGFEPALAPGGQAAGLRGQIDIAAPADEEGFALVRRLEERLGVANGPYELTANILISEEAVGFLTDGTITRFTVEGAVIWELKDGDTVLVAGREENITSYSATSTTVATLFAQRDARRRLMVILADRITAELLRTAPDWRP